MILRSLALACLLLPGTLGAQAGAAASYAGIGVQIDATTGVPVVVAVSPDGPAGEAGIQPGDQIVAIDGKPTTGWTQQAVATRCVDQAARPSPLPSIVRATIRER